MANGSHTSNVLGLDAGGSKTRVCLVPRVDPSPDSISTQIFGPGNFRQMGPTGIRALLREIIPVLELTPSDTLVVAGFAGAGTAESQQAIRQIFIEEGFRADNAQSITSDGGLLLWALGNDGIALVAGTGSICIGRRLDSSDSAGYLEVRAGGYGHRLPSEVGGYRLGIGAIEAAVAIEDGRRQTPTSLYESVKEHFSLANLQHIITDLYPTYEGTGDVRERVAELSGAVFAAAAAGDEVAVELVEHMVDVLADHVRAVHTKLGEQATIAGLHGGLFADPHAGELLTAPLCRHQLLNTRPLQFETLGVHPNDRDPLLEAMRFVTEGDSRHKA